MYKLYSKHGIGVKDEDGRHVAESSRRSVFQTLRASWDILMVVRQDMQTTWVCGEVNGITHWVQIVKVAE